MLSVSMATTAFVILVSTLFGYKPLVKHSDSIKSKRVFHFPFVSKIGRQTASGKKLFFFTVKRRVLIKLSVNQRMVHRHNKIVGKKSSLPPPPPLPSKIKETRTYVKQLEYELERLESMQPTALDAVRFHRFVSWRKYYIVVVHFPFLVNKRFTRSIEVSTGRVNQSTECRRVFYRFSFSIFYRYVCGRCHIVSKKKVSGKSDLFVFHSGFESVPHKLLARALFYLNRAFIVHFLVRSIDQSIDRSTVDTKQMAQNTTRSSDTHTVIHSDTPTSAISTCFFQPLRYFDFDQWNVSSCFLFFQFFLDASALTFHGPFFMFAMKMPSQQLLRKWFHIHWVTEKSHVFNGFWSECQWLNFWWNSIDSQDGFDSNHGFTI